MNDNTRSNHIVDVQADAVEPQTDDSLEALFRDLLEPPRDAEAVQPVQSEEPWRQAMEHLRRVDPDQVLEGQRFQKQGQ